ncbi:hypothetical protein GTO10_07005 [Candidatus Saccharibacteria bacterium]|nr:hypothetical protein [Candidatus Saccharibacteria bacterium]
MARRYGKVGKKRNRQPSSWRRLKSQFKIQKRLRRLKLALIVVAAVTLTLGGIYLWNLFTKPLASAASTFKSNVSWDGKTPLNLMYLEVSKIDELAPQTLTLGVLMLNPTQERFSAVEIPVGYARLADIYGLGNLSGERDGLRRLGGTLMDLLGIPIDGYVLVGSGGIDELSTLFPQVEELGEVVSLSNLSKLPIVWSIARRYVQTDLGLPEIVRVFWFLLQIRSDKVAHMSLGEELLGDPANLDKKLSPFVRDDILFAEHLKIQILNGSNAPGLAASSARMIRNIGGEVIRVDNFERQDLNKGYLILESSGSYTARRLAEIFGVSDSRPPRTGAEARANVTLILGIENAF